MRLRLQLAFRACSGLAAAFAIGTAVLAAQPPELEDLLDKAADSVAGYKRDFASVVADETYRQEAHIGAQSPQSLATVLERAGTYVLELQRQLAGIVAEEDYVQDVKVASGFPSTTRSGLPAVRHRVLKSDLLLVRPVGADRWMQFRDVFEVDGRPIRDRNERLMRLFVTPSSATANQAEQIANESSRYNIGNLQRTVNLPVLALAILEPRGQRRFVFKRIEKGGQVPVRSAAAAAKTVWVIGYREVESQTMIRTTNFRDMPARGRFWIEPESGEVLATELIAEDFSLRGEITVGYEREPTLNVMVPIHMKERYDLRRGPSPVTGEASYRSFRQFQVKVDERIAPIVKE